MRDPASAPERLLPGLAVVETEEGVAVTGGLSRHHFRGKGAKKVLPRLLHLLDGTQSREHIRHELGVSEAQLSQALALLDKRALLDHSPPAAVPEGLSDDATAYYGRTLGVWGYREFHEPVTRLSGSRVVVIGPSELASPLARDLLDAGVGQVTAATEERPYSWQATGAGADLAVALWAGGEADAEVSRAVDEAGRRQIPVLRVLSSAPYLEFGPYLLPGYSVCRGCLERGRRDAGWDAVPGSAVPSSDLQTMLGLAAEETVSSLLVGGGALRAARYVARFSTGDVALTRFLATPYSECRTCTMTWTEQEPSPEAVTIREFEWSVLGAPQLLQPQHSTTELERLTTLESSRPRLSSHPRQALPDAGPRTSGTFGDADAAPPQAASELDILGEVLRRVGGLRKSTGDLPRQRWAPTGGNLASVESYVVRAAGVTGLPGVVSRYDDAEHSLVAVRPDPVGISDVVSATDLPPESSYQVVIALVAIRARVARKYDAFSYRLVHLDAGVAMTQLDTVAAGYGCHTTWAERWDGRVAELLGLDPREQVVTGVVGVAIPRREEDNGVSSCR